MNCNGKHAGWVGGGKSGDLRSGLSSLLPSCATLGKQGTISLSTCFLICNICVKYLFIILAATYKTPVSETCWVLAQLENTGF